MLGRVGLGLLRGGSVREKNITIHNSVLVVLWSFVQIKEIHFLVCVFFWGTGRRVVADPDVQDNDTRNNTQIKTIYIYICIKK